MYSCIGGDLDRSLFLRRQTVRSVAFRVIALGFLVTVLVGPALSSAKPPEPTSEPILLDSTGSTYPFVMRLEGKSVRTESSIEVEIKSGIVSSSIPADLGADGLAKNVVLRMGIGRKLKDGWQMGNASDPLLLAAELRPGESLPITLHRFVVRGLGDSASLADVWLVASF